jgi:hypothetical protein
MPRCSRVAQVQVSAQALGPASVQAPVWVPGLVLVMAKVREPALVLAREPGPRLVGSMAPLALTNRRQRMLPRSAQTPQAEELT